MFPAKGKKTFTLSEAIISGSKIIIKEALLTYHIKCLPIVGRVPPENEEESWHLTLLLSLCEVYQVSGQEPPVKVP